MASIDYKTLYILQDKVMDVIFKAENIFYLTGGTCLSRFYQEKRYSDDLIIRLRTFPLSLLKNISLVDSSFLDNFEEKYKLIIEKIEKII